MTTIVKSSRFGQKESKEGTTNLKEEPTPAKNTLVLSNRSRVALPQLDGLVVLERRRRDDVLCGVASRAQDDVGVALQLLHDLLRLEVPNVNLKHQKNMIKKIHVAYVNQRRWLEVRANGKPILQKNIKKTAALIT